MQVIQKEKLKVNKEDETGREPEISRFCFGCKYFIEDGKKLFSLIYNSCKHKVGSIFRNGFEPLRGSQGLVLAPF